MWYAPFSSPSEHYFCVVQLPQQRAAMAEAAAAVRASAVEAAAAAETEWQRLEELRIRRRNTLLLHSDDQ